MSVKTVVFFCNWSAYPGMQMSHNSLGEVSSKNKMMVSMCSGRISPELVLGAFQKGAWGVLITACPVDKCEHYGNYKTYGRIALLRTMLQQLGVESKRLRMEWIDKGEAAKLKSTMDTFTNEMEALGPVHL